MEEIFVDKEINAKNVEETLQVLFPELKAFQWFPWDGDVNPTEFNHDESTHVLFNIYKESKRLEFQWRLSLYGQADGCVERERLFAKTLSERMLTRTLVAYQLPSEPHDPFYNLVYDKGVCYLADDSMFDWTGEAEEPSEPMKIVRPIKLAETYFDTAGRLTK